MRLHSNSALSIRLGLVIAVVVLTNVWLVAENKDLRQQAEGIWRKAEAVSTPDAAHVPPYSEQATFTLHTLKGHLTGTYTKEFADAGTWIEEVRLDTYYQVSIHKENNVYKHENADFAPLGVGYLTSALAPLKLVPEKNESVEKIFSIPVNGIDASCVETWMNVGVVRKHITCVSKIDGTLVSDSQWDKTTMYAGYVSFQGKLMPTQLAVFEGQQKLVEANVVYHEQPTLKPALIQVPAGMQPERQCNVRVPPKITSQSAPDMPPGTDLHDLNKTVVVRILIGLDGRVSKSMVAQSAGSAFDKNAEKTVRKWQFKPSLCDGVPVETRVDVEVNFRRYQ